MYTTSSIFLKSLADAGITHAFVNWGSDHPALLEDLERQRVEGTNSEAKTKPEIVTCPNEMVALSAAQGYAQVTGKPAAVIVHVDVGTQAMAGAIHNVDRSRTPVIIYAGASPFSTEKEHKGTRNEWIMWIQDIPDQSAIVRQYMRYTSQINSGATASKIVGRALQIAKSDPKGPVYLWARREVMEEEVDASLLQSAINADKWPSIEPTALSQKAVTQIASALLSAKSPLIITSHIGRNPRAVPNLTALSTLLGIPIFSVCPSVVNVPFSHQFFAGTSFLFPNTHTRHLDSADVIVVIDSDLPWIPANNRPSDSARVFVVDGGDPLKTNIGFAHTDAELVCRADAEVALEQIISAVRAIDGQSNTNGESVLQSQALKQRKEKLESEYHEYVQSLNQIELEFPPASSHTSASFTVPNIIGVLRDTIERLTPSRGKETLILNESISNYPATWTHMRSEALGSMISSGGSSLGWALGAAVGASLGGKVATSGKGYDLVIAIVGDGSFLFGVPSSAFWMARRYNTPFLTIVLNNGGWKSPKLSLLGVHPSGHGSKVSGDQLTVGFGPECPDYSQIAVAASGGWAWGDRIGPGGKPALEAAVRKAVEVVIKEQRCAILDCILESI